MLARGLSKTFPSLIAASKDRKTSLFGLSYIFCLRETLSLSTWLSLKVFLIVILKSETTHYCKKKVDFKKPLICVI